MLWHPSPHGLYFCRQTPIRHVDLAESSDLNPQINEKAILFIAVVLWLGGNVFLWHLEASYWLDPGLTRKRRLSVIGCYCNFG